MLEDKIDMAANGIKNGIGWIREHKKKIIGGALVGVGSAVGIGLAFKAGQFSEDENYMCLEESEIDEYYDPDCDDQDEITTEVEVTVEEVED